MRVANKNASEYVNELKEFKGSFNKYAKHNASIFAEDDMEDIDYDKPEHGKYVELAKRLQNHYPDVDFEKFDLMALLWKFKYN